MDKVIVIIPNYNHSSYLKQRIESVLNQSYQNLEIIILDDCSTDDSRTVIEDYRSHPKVSHILYNDFNSGSTFKQWKRGIDKAVGKYIWIAESDDVADPLFLETAIDAFSKNKSVGLVQSHSYYLKSNSDIKEIYKIYDTPYDWTVDFKEQGVDFVKKAMFINNSLINASAIVFRKEALINTMSNTHYKLNGDWFLYLSILSKYDFYHIGKPLNYFRQHNDNGSSKNIQNFSNLIEYADIITFLFRNFSLSVSEKDTLRYIFIQKWLKQNSNSLKKVLSNKFIAISKKVYFNDKLFLLRLLKQKLSK